MLYNGRRILLAIGLVIAGIGTASGQAKPYLALGDSIPFGFNPLIPLPPPSLAVYQGYPEFIAQSLGLSLANASCPGETSGSFISVTAPDNGCHEWRALLPLFVPYASSTESQLAYATSFLHANPQTRLVTITIGGDDLLLLENTCAAQSSNLTTVEECELAGLGKVFGAYAENLTKIYLALRFTARYEGPIVAVNYASTDYTNTLETLAVGGLNAITAELTYAFGGKVADVFSAFQKASLASGGLPCAASVPLSFPNPGTPLTCNPHPTLPGQQLIAKLVEQALQ